MSGFVRPHRQQPTRLPCPWDSPGNNTGVGCHFLLQCMKVKSESEVAQSCLILRDPMDCSLLCPWDFPGKSTGVGCHCLLCLFLLRLHKKVGYPYTHLKTLQAANSEIEKVTREYYPQDSSLFYWNSPHPLTQSLINLNLFICIGSAWFPLGSTPATSPKSYIPRGKITRVLNVDNTISFWLLSINIQSC